MSKRVAFLQVGGQLCTEAGCRNLKGFSKTKLRESVPHRQTSNVRMEITQNKRGNLVLSGAVQNGVHQQSVELSGILMGRRDPIDTEAPNFKTSKPHKGLNQSGCLGKGRCERRWRIPGGQPCG